MGSMNINEEDLINFKILYKKIYGTILTDSEAEDKAKNLLRLIELAFKPPP
jgi:hypothetical protein